MPKAVAEKRSGGKAKKDPNAPKRFVENFHSTWLIYGILIYDIVILQSIVRIYVLLYRSA